MYLAKRAQISDVKANEAPIKVFSKYTDFANVFSPKLAVKLPKYTAINDYSIKLVDDW